MNKKIKEAAQNFFPTRLRSDKPVLKEIICGKPSSIKGCPSELLDEEWVLAYSSYKDSPYYWKFFTVDQIEKHITISEPYSDLAEPSEEEAEALVAKFKEHSNIPVSITMVKTKDLGVADLTMFETDHIIHLTAGNKSSFHKTVDSLERALSYILLGSNFPDLYEDYEEDSFFTNHELLGIEGCKVGASQEEWSEYVAKMDSLEKLDVCIGLIANSTCEKKSGWYPMTGLKGVYKSFDCSIDYEVVEAFEYHIKTAKEKIEDLQSEVLYMREMLRLSNMKLDTLYKYAPAEGEDVVTLDVLLGEEAHRTREFESTQYGDFTYDPDSEKPF